MDRVQREAFEARAELEECVASLHRSGASLREIAEALDLSHQRIHQLLATEPGFLARLLRRPGPPRRAAKCSFCGTAQAEAERLIAGPGVYICQRCLERDTAVPFSGTTRCSFCGKRGRSGQTAIEASDGVRICERCVGLCREILAGEVR